MVVGAGINCAQIQGNCASLVSSWQVFISRSCGALMAPRACALHTTACVYTI
jgi:hypothetical protein